MDGKRAGIGATAVAATVAVLLSLSVPATAAPPEFILRTPVDGEPGSGAGRLDNPRGLVADPVTGHVYVNENENGRISEFTAWGGFEKAWGWGVADGAPELQACGPDAIPPTVTCQQGKKGTGTGQLDEPWGIARDGAGNLYVAEGTLGGPKLGGPNNFRVQKFSPDGQFLLMFGGEVNKTKVEGGAPPAEQNVCPISPGDVCQAGTGGTAPGYLSNFVGNYIAYSPFADAIVVGDKDRIEIFDTDGSFREEIPFEGELEAFDGETVTALAVDLDGNIYVALRGNSFSDRREDVFKLSPSAVPLDPGKPGSTKFKVEAPKAVAVDTGGNVYVIDESSDAGARPRIFSFDAAGNQLFPTKGEEEENEFFPYIPPGGPPLNGLATNICAGGGLYLSANKAGSFAYLEGYGTPPVACEDPPLVPPEITTQYAARVGTESATLRADINPIFWDDTTYDVEYGTGLCSAGGCDNHEPVPPALLTDKVVGSPVPTSGVFLSGLVPGATYHYRFVAQSTGGGPAFGVDPDGKEGEAKADFENGEESTFSTFALPASPEPCGNDQFRSGPSGELPDCRAYELVSPLDKSNGDAAVIPSTKAFHEVNQSSTSGERFTYSSTTPFADPESAPFISQYLSSRDPATGWTSGSISPPRSGRPLILRLSLSNEFRAFSPDLCTAWMEHNSESTLVAGAIPTYPNLYRRGNCSEPPSFEALSTAEPPNRLAGEYRLTPVGFSEDGRESIFLANGALVADAPELAEEELQLYVHGPKGLRFVCYLPNGNAYGFACAAGAAAGVFGASSILENAISDDGSRVFWTAYSGAFEAAPKPGKIYVRLNPEEEPSAVQGPQCTDPENEKACTVPISQVVSGEPAEYWGASDDGSKAVFKFTGGLVKDDLYEFDVDTQTPRLIAKGVEGPMGMSEDASRIYFSSTKVVGEGASEGAEEGAHNLYLYEAPEGEADEGNFRFIMTLVAKDLFGTELVPGAIKAVPTARSSVVSADGLHAAFTSAASPTPTGYDNLDVESRQPNQEAYLYDAEEDELLCVSCNPTNARPAGVKLETGWAAARLPNVRVPLNPPAPLAPGGNRLFFESHEALVPRDGNGTWDVYQWEALGTGSCDEGDPTFGSAAAGCVELISSGESSAPSRLLDADQSGADVFIGTQASLIATDFGSNDVYDARIGGGFPLPQTKAPCEGGACQSPPGPPADVTPASSTFEGKGNADKARRCKKGTRKVRRQGKSRCVKKQKRRAKKASPERRAPR